MNLKDLTAIKIASQAAAIAHLDQVRKDGVTPYIVHPACVSLLVQHYGGSCNSIVAAWMHDIIEDCKDDVRIVEKSLNAMPISVKERKTIREVVDSLTKDRYLQDEHERLIDTLNRIKNAPPEATLVKICDRIDNLIDARDRESPYIQRYLKETDDIIEILGERAKKYGYSGALEELIRVRDQMTGRS